jgi:hypothetical protein
MVNLSKYLQLMRLSPRRALRGKAVPASSKLSARQHQQRKKIHSDASCNEKVAFSLDSEVISFLELETKSPSSCNPDPVPLRATLPNPIVKLVKKKLNEAAGQPPSRFGEFYMAWYAYCLTEHQTLPNGTRSRRPFVIENVQGVNGAPVLSYPSGEFAVIVSEYDQNSGTLDQKAAIDHARVVSGCFRNSTVLPFRFGTIFETDDALRQAVRVNRRTFGQSVEKLRGKSEMHIKLTVTDGSLREAMIDVVLPDTVGGDYLSKLRVKASRERERQTKARALSVQVHKLFNPLEEEVSCKKVAPEGMLIDIAHLIDSKSVEKYQNRYSTAAKQLKNCEVAISGPWPPYHFLPGKLRTVTGNS